MMKIKALEWINYPDEPGDEAPVVCQADTRLGTYSIDISSKRLSFDNYGFLVIGEFETIAAAKTAAMADYIVREARARARGDDGTSGPVAGQRPTSI